VLNLAEARWGVWHDYHGENKEGEVIGVPFLISSAGFGVIFDSPSKAYVDLREDGRIGWEAEVVTSVSFFVMVSGEGGVGDLYGEYRRLTGVTPLPPRGALGYIQCKQRYASQGEVLAVAREYRKRGYPCDMMVVDWFHWKELGDLALDPVSWPDPAGMNRELAEMGFMSMISVWPRFMEKSRYFPFLVEKKWVMTDKGGGVVNGVPEDQRGVLYDATNPEAREWLWERVRENYAAAGFNCWWLDEDEPDISPHRFMYSAGSGASLMGIYPLVHTGGIYQGHRRDRKDRCFILSRSAYLGAQRHGTTFWSSDIYPTWDVYRRQIPAGLNFCASGFAYWSSDIGGWQAIKDTPEWKGAEEESSKFEVRNSKEVQKWPKGYVELYIRWFQYSAFCPTFRAHGTREVNEVWGFGEEAEGILVKYLRLRYKLLPYIYDAAWRVTRTGEPMMRALFMDYPDDPQCRDIGDQYMFGGAFLVAPVVERGAVVRRMYLPAGNDWYDFETQERYAGGQWVEVAAGLGRIPVMVRAGSIVPMGRAVNHGREKQALEVIKVYAGADGVYCHYEDDGVSCDYEKGAFVESEWRWDEGRGVLENAPGGVPVIVVGRKR